LSLKREGLRTFNPNTEAHRDGDEEDFEIFSEGIGGTIGAEGVLASALQLLTGLVDSLFVPLSDDGFEVLDAGGDFVNAVLLEEIALVVEKFLPALEGSQGVLFPFGLPKST